MKRIWKFPLEVNDESTVMMPRGAKILCVQVQGNQVCLWAIVDRDAPSEARRFRVIGTGHSCEYGLMNPAEREYIGTFQLYGGGLVFHVFEALGMKG